MGSADPAERWTAQQAIEAFPLDAAPRYLVRDRDSVHGEWFRRRVKHMGIDEVVIAPRSPWQNPFAARVIGSMRREGHPLTRPLVILLPRNEL